MKTTRVLLADDHDIVRRGLAAALADCRHCQVCGEASNGREAVEKARQLRPDIVILDVSMPDLNGVDATRRIRAALPDTEVLVMTMHESDELVREILAAGARGYLLKSDAGRLLPQAVEALREHKPYFSPHVSQVVLAGYLSPEGLRDECGAGKRLTPREREIIQMVAEGKSSKEVAALLEISVKTVEAHRGNIMQKLGYHSVSELVRYAIRNKIIEP
jgi:DNA-binding NarL/FixJ family response regulator